MKVTRTERGFEVVEHPMYPPGPEPERQKRVAQQSSAIGDYPDAFDRPGSSCLWVGEHHHLNRAEVAALVGHLRAWLDSGSLVLPTDETPTPLEIVLPVDAFEGGDPEYGSPVG